MAKKKSATKSTKKMNETGRRDQGERREEAVEVKDERRKVKRRRQIDPTTCEREYNNSEIEFMQAMDDYKRASGRMFPTCSEILEVVLKLGYRKVAEPGQSFDFEDNNELSEEPLTLEEELDVI